MKKFLFHLVQLAVILSLLLSLQACGSRDDGSDTTGTTTGTTTDGGTTTPGETADVADLSISASPAAIDLTESSTVTVTLLNSTGQKVTAAKEVVFSLSAPTLASMTPPTVTTVTGTATSTFTAKGIEGIVTVTASVDGQSATQDIQISKTIAANTLTAAADPTSIANGATSAVSATVLDQDGNPMPDGTTVTFTVDNPALGTIDSSAQILGGGGVARATFQAGSDLPGTVTVKATAGAASDTTTIEVTGATASNILFVSATPQIISLKGTGGQETSEVKFVVQDNKGIPIVTSQSVTLELSGPNGGEYIGDTPGKTSVNAATVNGEVSTILHSGTIPGTATIKATIVGTNLSTSSGVIAIGGGTPSAGHFDLSTTTFNLAGLYFSGVEDNINVQMADRYGAKNILEGTTVSFYSECGAIDTALTLDGEGKGFVVFRTQTPDPEDVDPDTCGVVCDEENDIISDFQTFFGIDIAATGHNPRDGLCAIIAVVDGEEEFTDQNASGTYDEGEPFVDTYDDIHIEKDDDREDIEPLYNSTPVYLPGYPYDSGFEDLVVDRDKNFVFDGLDGAWDYNKRVSKKIDLLITGAPILRLSTTSINVPNGDSQTIYFALHDINFNPPIAGTTISVTSTGSGTLSGVKTFTYDDKSDTGRLLDTPIHYVTISDSDPGTDEIQPVTLEFSWSWGGTDKVLSYSGITH